MSYGAWKLCAYAFLVVFFVAGTLVRDAYPFFNWALFSRVPNTQTTYTIEVSKVGVREFDPPLPFSETRFLFEKIGQSPTDYTQAIVNLAQAMEEHDAARVVEERATLEKIFGGEPYRYTLLSVEYDPLELWKSGTYESSTTIAVFEGI
jgi:hypothetical protein